MAKSIYSQLNQASSIGADISKFLEEIIVGNPQKYASESAAMDVLSSSASSEAEFQKLDKVLEDYWKRNNMHGPVYEAKEIKQRADYMRRKDEYYKYKEAHNQALKMIDSNYLISATDKDGGIQNITTNDISSWNHERLTEELGKVNRIKDSLALAQKGYNYSLGKDNPNSTLSIARDIDTYYKNLTAALEIAIETGELPKDDVLLRAILSGDKAKVKEHSGEQRQIAAERYKEHDGHVNSYESLLNKMTAYEEKPDEFFNLMGNLLKEKPEDMEKNEYNKALAAIGEVGGGDGFQLNYSSYVNNLNASLTRSIEQRDIANKRHKAYSGKLYEDVGTEISEGMAQWRDAGYSEEVIDKSKIKTIEDGGVTDEVQGTTLTIDVKDKKVKEEKIKQTDFDKKSFRNQPETFPSLKKAKGKFVFTHEGDMAEWDNLAYVEGFKDKVPVLKAGYDKYFWHNGKWNHMSKAPRKKAPAINPAYPLRASQTKYERGVALGEAKKDIEKVISSLGFTKTGDATKKATIAPIKENVSQYGIKKDNKEIKSLWNKYSSNFPQVKYDDFASSVIQQWGELSKEQKSNYGSFNKFIQSIMQELEILPQE